MGKGTITPKTLIQSTWKLTLICKPPQRVKATFTCTKDEVAGITVADVAIDEMKTLQSSSTKADVDAVHNAASELVDAIKGQLDEAKLTLTLGDKDSKTFNLNDTAVEIEVARYLLDGQSPADFLEQKATVKATYKVEATKDEVTFELNGDLEFTAVEVMTSEKAKAPSRVSEVGSWIEV